MDRVHEFPPQRFHLNPSFWLFFFFVWLSSFVISLKKKTLFLKLGPDGE